MELVTIYKSSLESIMSDMSRANLVCSDVAGWAKDLADTEADENPVCDKLFMMVRVLGLLGESLDRIHDYLHDWVHHADRYIAQPQPGNPAPLVATPDVNYDDFKDLTQRDIFEAMLEQAKIRDIARKEWQILNNLLAMRQQDGAA